MYCRKIETLFTKDAVSYDVLTCYYAHQIPQGEFIPWGIGASDRSFYPIFNKRFDYLETLLTKRRSKNVLSAGSLCGPLVPSPQSKCPKMTFMLP